MAKEFSISFYVANVTDDANRVGLEMSLRELVNERRAVSLRMGDNIYIAKELETWNNGRNFKGVFGKIRMSDLPHLANGEGVEQRLQLAADQGLIEKNHFIFTARHQLLIFQENFHGSRVGTFAHYLTLVRRRTVAFNPILNSDAMARLMRRGTELRKVDLTVARPTNPAHYPRDVFSRGLLELMGSSDAASISIHMSANLSGQRGNTLNNRIRRALRDLVVNDYARTAYVEIETDEGAVPLDLLVDRVKARVTVEMDDRYPISDRMFEAMEQARRQSQASLTAFFGAANAEMD